MNNDISQILKEAVQEVVAKMGFEGVVEIDVSLGDFIVAKIKTDDAALLIGQKGENLAALQYLTKIILGKKEGALPLSFIVDVNDYRIWRINFLKDMALSAAKQVAQERRVKFLEPMPPYERRLVHMALKDFEGVKTESQGEGEERRIVIKPSSDVS